MVIELVSSHDAQADRPRAAVMHYRMVDTQADPAFDRIAALAARLMQVPMVLICIVEGSRIWVKSHHGCPAAMLAQVADLCASTRSDDTPLVVRDALHDARMASHPLVTGGFGLRFYASAPLRMPDGERVGSLCLLDQRSRAPSRRAIDNLRSLAAIVVDQLAARDVVAGNAECAEPAAGDAPSRPRQPRAGRSPTAMRRVAMALQTVREEERKRISRELHDDLGQLLATLRIELSRLQLHGPRLATAGTLQKMDELLVASIDSLRRIATDLRPKALDEGGLYFALRSLLENFSARHGIRYELHAEEADLVLDDAYGTAVFRIVQESLTNISRHACASQVVITVTREANQLAITIRDNGRGIRRRDLTKRHSFGLLGMRERVKEMGGDMAVSGLHRQGTCIAIVLPLPA